MIPASAGNTPGIVADLRRQADMTNATGVGNCVECDTPLTRKGGGPKPTYCSASCRVKASARRAKADGRDKQWAANAAAKRAAERDANTRECPYCGDLMTHPRRVQCGKAECKRLWTNDRMRAYQKNYRAKHGVAYSQTFTYERICIHCRNTWKSRNRNAIYCSSACQAAHQHGPDRTPKKKTPGYLRSQRLKRRLARAARGTKGVIPFVSGPCASCGKTTTARRGELRWCSLACKNREKAIRRRAREHDAFIEDVPRLAIFLRDNWTCQICNQPVDPDAQTPHPLAPTLDHIVPLAKGGTHEASNLQLAHFICNSTKRDEIDAVLAGGCDSL